MQFTFLIADYRSWEQWEVVWSKKLKLRLLFDLDEMSISEINILIFQNIAQLLFYSTQCQYSFCAPSGEVPEWERDFVLCMVQGPGNHTHLHASITSLGEPTAIRLLTWDPRRRKFSPAFLAILGKGQIFSTVPFKIILLAYMCIFGSYESEKNLAKTNTGENRIVGSRWSLCHFSFVDQFISHLRLARSFHQCFLDKYPEMCLFICWKRKDP